MKLVLVRHGESEWTRCGKFTGWSDVGMSDDGVASIKEAGDKLAEFEFTHVYSSALQRSKESARIVLERNRTVHQPPIQSSWRLNERHYGKLEGLVKKEVSREYGEEQVKKWRRGYTVRPPEIDKDDPRHPQWSPLYKEVDANDLPSGESPEDCFRRVSMWFEEVRPQWTSDSVILICAHGTSLRILMQMIENLPSDVIEKTEIPSSVPVVYELNGETKKEILIEPDKLLKLQEDIRNQSKINLSIL